jgi:hypothetical protein
MRHVEVARSGSRTGIARHLGFRLATALLALAVPAAARAAEGAKVLSCIEAVSKASWADFQTRELLAAVACQGIRDLDAGSREFQEKVAVLRDCIKKVSWRLDAKGTEAELIAANACVGATSPDQTAACMDKVERSFRHAKDALAETLAATACSRGNAAEETATCVKTVAFRLSASGTLADTLAAIACGR